MTADETPFRFTYPPIEDRPSPTCPACGKPARIHARVERAIYDWDTTFVASLRLTCCGRTFTVSPRGLAPGARYSVRVVALARSLVALGVSMRHTVRLLKAARVPVALESLRAWCRGVEPRNTGCSAALGGQGDVLIPLRTGCSLALSCPESRSALAVLHREAERLLAAPRRAA